MKFEGHGLRVMTLCNLRQEVLEVEEFDIPHIHGSCGKIFLYKITFATRKAY